ncbi:unnamed protein product [Urochloa humidicola]
MRFFVQINPRPRPGGAHHRGGWRPFTARCRRLHHALQLPSVLCSQFSPVDGPPSSAIGNPDEIAKLFPNLFRQPSALLVPSTDDVEGKPLKVSVVLSGGQAPGGHIKV